jgi:hypothetical protein
MWEQLTTVDTETAVLVAPADDPEDWVACFEKRAGFPAQAWAERMVALHNRGERKPLEPVGSVGEYGP